jgi:hypothetical protein
MGLLTTIAMGIVSRVTGLLVAFDGAASIPLQPVILP